VKLDPTSLKRLTYAKYLYLGAADGLRSTHPLTAAKALLRVHDAVEMFQLVVLEAVGASGKFEFMNFWEQVKVKTSREPPYKDRMGQLNHVRVGFKHKGVLPDLSELRDLADIVLPFFSEVSREFLNVDLSTLSLAELIDDAEAQRHLSAAATLIDAQNYDEAVVEAAKAFYVVATKDSPRTPWGPHGSDFFDLDTSAHGHTHLSLRASLSNVDGVAGLVRAIDDRMEALYDQILRQARLLEMLTWKIDLKRYGRFSHFIPYVSRTGDGKFHVQKRMGVRRPITARDARFCFHFVVDTALIIQRQSHELPDLYGSQRIKPAAAGAKFYTLDNKGAASETDQIPETEELEGLYGAVYGVGDCWVVIWKGVRGWVKTTEVIQLDVE